MNLLNRYLKTYSGLTTGAWMLSLVMLINRTGSMVIPFLSIYLKSELNLGLDQVGIILGMHGLGSLAGVWIGGWLTDRVGSYIVQLVSLTLSGLGFLILMQLTTFPHLAIGFFAVTLAADTFRPANAAALTSYVKPENLTKAFSLNRMAINMGFALGPAIGGFLAATSYQLIFIADGATCILAALVFGLYFRRFKTNVDSEDDQTLSPENNTAVKSPYRDKSFIIFCFYTFLFAGVFFQFLFTLPLFYREICLLSETYIGWILGFNGGVVFLLEMPIVHRAARIYRLKNLLFWGNLLCGLSFLVLGASSALVVLFLGMFLLSISEILVMPFLTTYTAQRGNKTTRGKYLGMHGMAYSLALIAAPLFGTFIIDQFGYHTLWYTRL
ncbi:MAG: MFS transporter [Flavobacteriales bacterium]|nr:MFS transporter [Flavobacteriales bacterium]